MKKSSVKLDLEAYRLFVENANDIFYTISPQGIFTYVSPRWADYLGHDPADVVGKSFEVFVHPEDMPLFRTFLERVVSSGKKQEGVQYRVQHKDGRWLWHESNASPLKDASGKISKFLGTARDITEKKELENDLFETSEKLENLLMELPVAVMIVDYSSRRILELNPKAVAMLGYNSEELAGRSCNDHVCPADKGNCPIIDLKEDVNHSEREIINSSGKKIPIYKSAIITHLNGRKVVLECFTDISQMKAMEHQLQVMTRTDDLTGLFNRRYFMERMKEEIDRAERYNFSFSLIIFDIDHFKNINDRYGHPAGDKVLSSLSRICRENLRKTDIPARIGGEEFGIILPGCGIEQAGISAERLRKNIAAGLFEFEGKEINCTISLGVAEYDGYGQCLEDLMRRADQALYQAKNTGRNRVVMLEGDFLLK
ncbi:MAG: sensor domain-containing diguanylate cyclase [Thermodesulfobacteriota bacterium]